MLGAQSGILKMQITEMSAAARLINFVTSHHHHPTNIKLFIPYSITTVSADQCLCLLRHCAKVMRPFAYAVLRDCILDISPGYQSQFILA